ncbi:MAG TPA: PAS domain-containing protein [Coleofasciculaceae cyanobacterium]
MTSETQRTVLLIDDSAEDRAVYCRYLQRDSQSAYHILEADCGAAGLEICQSALPDIILLDYSLPDIDGLAFLDLLAQQLGGQCLPVLMLTGQGNERIAVQAIKSGAQDYLVKSSLTADSLRQIVKGAIEQLHLQRRLAEQQHRLQQQQQQQQIIAAIALRIRQSLTLRTILDTSVAEVRQCMNADRVVVYQFASDMSGQIVAEAVLPEWGVSLHVQIEDTCFRQNLGGEYRLGRIRAIADIYDADLTDCHMQLLEQFQVKANLVVPILIDHQASHLISSEPGPEPISPEPINSQPRLWGLLVVHQCAAPRQWQPFETDLLSQVAVQMAIAIQQAELYVRLQSLKTELETKVQERTEKLKASEASLREAQRIAGLGNWEFDLITQKITWSEELFRIYQLDPSQPEPAYAEHLQDFTPEHRDRLTAAVQRAATTGDPYEIELQFSRTDGSVGWILGRGEALRNPQGEIVKLLGTALDITDRKLSEIERQQATASLRASEERWQLALQANNDGIWDWNISTHEIFYSTRWKEMLGYQEHEIQHYFEEWSSRVHPDDFEQVMERHYAHMQQKIPYEAEYRMRCKDGTYKWILDRGQALWDANGVPIRMVGSHADISARKQAEVQLRNLSDRLTLAITSGAIGIWEWDIVHNELIWDDRMYELYGVAPSDFRGAYQVWEASLHPDDRAFSSEAVQQALRGEKEFNTEFRVVLPDGTIRILKASAITQRNQRGEPLRMIGINYDITERKRIEEALQQANEQLELRVEQRTLALRQSNQQLELEIAERQQTEAALRESEGRFRATFNQAAVGIAHVGLEGRWLRVNQKLCEIVGYTQDELLSCTFQDITHPDDLESDLSYVQQLLANEIQSYAMEKRYIRKDGSFVWINLTGSLVRMANLQDPTQPGKPRYFIAVIEDIRVRKQAEQALQDSRQQLETQVQKRTQELTAANTALKAEIMERVEAEQQLAALAIELQQSNQELEQFAYVASHDLQEPLRAITSYTQLLAKRYQGQLDEKADKYIHYAVDGASRMQRLIQDLLAYSRIGRYELKQQPTNCYAVLDQVVKDLQVAIAESQATIHIEPLPTLLADSGQLAQIFQNLIGNAIKYRGESAPVITVSASRQGLEWIFSVQDNGIGIEPQYTERIFGIFQRLHTRREYEGTGLGLAICKKMVERHHGRIWVESQLGQGTTFFFSLPDP